MPQSGNSEVNSCPVQLSKQTEQQEVVQEIYFGIFFDGTNNNKLQVMLGKRYRRDKCLREVIAKANKCEYSWNQIKFLIDKGIIEGKVFLVEKRMDPDSRFPVPSKSMPLNKETYEQLKKEHKLNNIIFNSKVNGNGLINIDRELWETPKKDKYTDSDDIIDAVADKRGRGILSQSQIDELYFGYDSKDPDLYFIEDRISRQLDDRDYSPENEINGSSAIGWDKSEKTDHFSFASYKAGDNERIKRDADSFTSQNSGKHEVPQTNFKSPSQGSTYTNVVILESLYEASLGMTSDDVERKFYSIYVEGSGSDMVFRNFPSYLHVAGDGLFGLGKGTGGSGTVAKVRKVARKVSTIVKGFPNSAPKLSFDIFGFSRGATAARIYTYLLNPKKILHDRLNTVHEWKWFEKIGLGLKNMNDYELLSGAKEGYLNTYDKTVRFLGIYDTVSSIGVFREDWLSSTLKVGAANAIGAAGSRLDKLINESRDLIAKGFDYGSSLFIRALYESTLNNPFVFANTFLMGLSPIFFIKTRNLGNEEVLGLLISKYPALKDTPVDTLRKQLQAVRQHVVEKYENYINGKYLSDMEEPDLPVFGKSKYHDQNVYDYGLFATNQAESVFHICALDELRSNFALVDIESSIRQNGLELFIPGCHTDIGGGCSLGRDGTKIANIANNNGTPNFICRQDSFDKEKMEYVPVSSLGLTVSGWIDAVDDTFAKGTFFKGNRPTKKELKNTEGTIYTDNSDSWIHVRNLIMNRYVNPGYSNIGLHLMHDKANKKNKMFKDIPISYDVPEKLLNYYSEIKKTVQAKETGRYFVRPSKALYSILRSDWLHFSSNDQLWAIADNIVVNPPNYVGAYYNQDDSRAKDHVFLYGQQLNFEKQQHPVKKVLSNIENELNNKRILTFLIGTNAGIKVSTMEDVMLATRIIYSGTLGSRDVRERKYMFDYCPPDGNIINVSSDAYINTEKYAIVFRRLNNNKFFLEKHTTLCQDCQDFMNHGCKEEAFYISKNAVLLAANNLSAKLPKDIDEQRFKKAFIVSLMTVASLPEGKDKNYLTYKTANIGYKVRTCDELSVSDLADIYIDAIFNELKITYGYSEEASTWIIEKYTLLRDVFSDWIAGLCPGASKNGYVQAFLNAPEIGKILGHTAALIQNLNKAEDWNTEKLCAQARIRAINIQIEELEKDTGIHQKRLEARREQMESSAQLSSGLDSSIRDTINYVIYEEDGQEMVLGPNDANPITQGEGYKVANAPKWIEQDRNGKRYKMLVDSSGTILDEQEISN